MKITVKALSASISKFLLYVAQPHNNPTWLAVILLILETFLTVATINSRFQPAMVESITKHLSSNPFDNASLNFLIWSLLCIAIQICCQISFIRGMYIPIFLASFNRPSSYGIIYLFRTLLVVSLMIDVIKSTQNSFYRNIIWSERYNQFKSLHFTMQLGFLYALGQFGPTLLNMLVIGSISLLMVMLRRWLPSYCVWFSLIQQLQYLSYFVACLLAIGYKTLHITIKPDIVLIIILLVYYKIAQKRNKLKNYHELIKSNSLLHIIQCYLSYLSSNRYSKKVECQIIQLFREAEVNIQSQMRLNRNECRKKLATLLEYAKTQHNCFQYNLLTAQIQFYVHSNYFRSILILRRMESQTSKFFIFENLCIYRLKSDIIKQIQFRRLSMGLLQSHFEENSYFISLLQMSTEYYRLWWQCILDQQEVLTHLEMVSNNLFESRKKMKEHFEQLEYVGVETLVTYSCYLYSVERNVQLAANIFRKSDFYFNLELDIGFNTHLYIEISAEESTFGDIRNISSNSVSLISIPNNALIGRNIFNLVPGFFRQEHQKRIQRILTSGNSSSFYVFQSRVLLEDGEGNFHNVFIKLAINFRQQYGLVLSGFIRMPRQKDIIHVAFDQESGQILGGNKWLRTGLGRMDSIQQITKCDQFLSNFVFESGKRILIYPIIQNLQHTEVVTVVKKLKYGNKVAVILESVKDQKQLQKTLKTLVVGSPLYKFEIFPIKGSSSIWTFTDKKHDMQKKTITPKKALLLIVVIWCLHLGFISCIFANLFEQEYNYEIKKEHASYMDNVRVQEMGMLQLLSWARQIDFNYHNNLILWNMSYNNFTSMKIKYHHLVTNINAYSINNTYVIQNVEGHEFQTDIKVLMKQVTSSLAFILDFINYPNNYTHQIVFEQIDYIIYNWKAVGCSAPEVTRQYLKTDYGSHDHQFALFFTHVFFAGFVFEILLIAAFLILDSRIRKSKTLIFQHFSCLQEEDIKVFLTAINDFRWILQGRPRTQILQTINLEISSFDKPRQSFFESNLSISKSNLDLSRTWKGIQRVSYTENTQQTEGDQQMSPHKRRLLPLKAKPNWKLYLSFLFFDLCILALSSTAFSYTQSSSYNLLDYMHNSFYMQKKSILFYDSVSSYARIILGFYDIIDSRMQVSSIHFFYELTDKYNKDLREFLDFKKQISQSESFSDFNSKKKQVGYDPVCSYAKCQVVPSILNITLDDGMQNNIQLIKDIINKKMDYLQILQSQTIQILAYSLKLYLKIYFELLEQFRNCLRKHNFSTHEILQSFYRGILLCSFMLIVLCIIPITLSAFKSFKKNEQLLGFIQKDNYIRNDEIDQIVMQEESPQDRGDLSMNI